ncbi:hypothetical protein [Acinetobacter colistiniresistens]|uniref:hypothetical protein n=1 Tax=Acinetobacter colistiniresistens TaxID=280145 RepID=UPI001250991A|nr:hypothetical protein [Acinetobacter colistiniresistens]
MSYKDFINFNLAGVGVKAKPQVEKDAIQLDGLTEAAQSMSDDASIDTIALNSEIQANRYLALALLLTLCDDIISGDLDEGETAADRLDALLSIAEDETDEESQNFALSILIANIQDAAVSLGVPADVAIGAFDDSNPEVQDSFIDSMADFVNANVPDGEEFDQFREDFVYGSPDKFEPDEAEQLDQLDGLMNAGKTSVKKRNGRTLVYRAVKAIRNGKIKVVNKRIGGSAKLSAKQKQAVKRMQAKSQRGGAIKKRQRSLQKGKNANLYR